MESEKLERRRQTRKREVVETAVQMLIDDGVRAVTLGRVASSLGLTTPALYRYFSSIDELMREVYLEISARVAARFVEVMTGAEQHAQEAPWRDDAALRSVFRLLALAHAIVHVAHTHPQLTAMIHQVNFGGLPLGEPSAQSQGASVSAAEIKPIKLGATLFEAAVAEGALPADGDAMERFVIYWSGLQSLTALGASHRQVVRGTGRAADLGMQSARALLLGWGVDPDRLKRAVGLADAWADSLA